MASRNKLKKILKKEMAQDTPVLTAAQAIIENNPSIVYEPFDYNMTFENSITDLKTEGRYRVFTNILRKAGEFPNARCFQEVKPPQEAKIEELVDKHVTVWCSNDYLGKIFFI